MQIRTYSISTAWHFTGDIGYYNENGEVFVTERKADYIFSGGEFFSPDVIENVIRRYSAIEEVAVVTTRNYEGNRYPIAYITTKPGKKVKNILGMFFSLKIKRYSLQNMCIDLF